MVQLCTEIVYKHRSQLSITETHQKGFLQGTILTVAVAALITVATASTPKMPIHTSILTGQ